MEDEGRAHGSSPFGILLRRYRLAAGLSQEGYRRTPQRETLVLLADALALNDEQRREFEASAARSVLLGRGAAVTVGPSRDESYFRGHRLYARARRSARRLRRGAGLQRSNRGNGVCGPWEPPFIEPIIRLEVWSRCSKNRGAHHQTLPPILACARRERRN